MSSTTPQTDHRAAIIPSKSSPLELANLQTPTPGPEELLIQVHSIALNPIDWKQQASGFRLAAYPAVLGSDISGTVISSGSTVHASAPKPGDRIAAFAPCFFKLGKPQYGAFQEKVLVPAINTVALPKELTFNEGSLLPMAVLTAWAGFYSIGIPREKRFAAGDKQGFLVWGGASSVGSAVVQVAKSLGFVVYAVASEKHSDYLKGLGASQVFDYKTDGVVDELVQKARNEGVVVNWGYDSVGALEQSFQVLSELKGSGEHARLASATHLPADLKKVVGVEATFVSEPVDEKEQTEFFHFVFGKWLQEKLVSGEFVPSPKIRVIEGGLGSVQEGLDVLKKGVSGEKLVIEV